MAFLYYIEVEGRASLLPGDDLSQLGETLPRNKTSKPAPDSVLRAIYGERDEFPRGFIVFDSTRGIPAEMDWQEWGTITAADGKTELPVFVGMDASAEPEPELLRREETLFSSPVTLNGSRWQVPVLMLDTGRSALPRAMGRTVSMRRYRAFEPLGEAALEFARRHMGASQFDVRPGDALLAAKILAINYRVGIPEIELLELFGSVYDVFAVLTVASGQDMVQFFRDLTEAMRENQEIALSELEKKNPVAATN